MKHKAKLNGFSLLEVLIALFLVGSSALGIIKLQASLEQQSSYILQQTEAMYIAERQLERYLARGQSPAESSGLLSYAQLESSDNCLHSQIGANGFVYAIDCQVEAVSALMAADLKMVKVTVTWHKRVSDGAELNAQHQLSLVSQVSKFSEFDL